MVNRLWCIWWWSFSFKTRFVKPFQFLLLSIYKDVSRRFRHVECLMQELKDDYRCLESFSFKTRFVNPFQVYFIFVWLSFNHSCICLWHHIFAIVIRSIFFCRDVQLFDGVLLEHLSWNYFFSLLFLSGVGHIWDHKILNTLCSV